MTLAAELWECANCFHKGPLDRHGRCENCNSNAVISTFALGQIPEVAHSEAARV